MGALAQAAASSRLASRSWPAGSKKASVEAFASREPDAKWSAILRALATSVTYDSGFHHQLGASAATCCGSKTHTGPRAARGPRVASTMSRLLEVTRTAPGPSRIAGTARRVVLPVRGPQMSTCMSSYEPNSGWRPLTDRPMNTPGVFACTPSRSAVAAAPFIVSLPSSSPFARCWAAPSTSGLFFRRCRNRYTARPRMPRTTASPAATALAAEPGQL